MEIRNRLSYEVFLKEVSRMVKEIVGESYIVELQQVLKNNGMLYDGIRIGSSDESVMPNIYLMDYYEQYKQGIMELEHIVEEVIHIYNTSSMERGEISTQFCFEYPEIKPNLIFRLINQEKNKALLQEIPYIPFLDFAITFHCIVKMEESGIGSIRITKEHCNAWKVNAYELFGIACKNTPELFPASIRTMEEVIKELLTEEIAATNEEEKEMILDMIQEKKEEEESSMYVLTNKKGINGATCLLYREVLEEFSKHIGGDFYILPSSIHEVILVPEKKAYTKESLKEMVTEVNDTKVPVEEILSGEVYLYSEIQKDCEGIYIKCLTATL